MNQRGSTSGEFLYIAFSSSIYSLWRWRPSSSASDDNHFGHHFVIDPEYGLVRIPIDSTASHCTDEPLTSFQLPERNRYYFRYFFRGIISVTSYESQWQVNTRMNKGTIKGGSYESPCGLAMICVATSVLHQSQHGFVFPYFSPVHYSQSPVKRHRSKNRYAPGLTLRENQRIGNTSTNHFHVANQYVFSSFTHCAFHSAGSI